LARRQWCRPRLSDRFDGAVLECSEDRLPLNERLGLSERTDGADLWTDGAREPLNDRDGVLKPGRGLVPIRGGESCGLESRGPEMLGVPTLGLDVREPTYGRADGVTIRGAVVRGSVVRGVTVCGITVRGTGLAVTGGR